MPRFAIFHPHPGDPLSGAIVQITSKSQDAMEADSRSFIEIPMTSPQTIDLTHEVVAGELVERSPI